MGTPFPSDAVGGVTLLTPAIQSPNFSIASQTGWAIMQNGDAYFFDLEASGAIIVGVSPDTQIELTDSGGVGQLLFLLNNSSYGNGLLESAIVGGAGQIVLNGPKLLSAPDFVGEEWNSNTGSPGASANWQLIYTDGNGTGHIYLAVGAGGTYIPVVQAIAALEPGTGTSDTNPGVAEGWHFASPPAGWTNDLIYKLYPDNTAGFAGTIILPSSGSYNGVTFTTLPSAYWPQGTKRMPVVCLAQSSAYGNNSSSPGLPYIEVTTSGVVSFGGLPASINSSSVGIDGVRYPLDV